MRTLGSHVPLVGEHQLLVVWRDLADDPTVVPGVPRFVVPPCPGGPVDVSV